MAISSRKLIYILCALVSFLTLFHLQYLPIQPTGNVLSSGWQIQKEDNWQPISLPYLQPIQELTTVVIRKEITYSRDEALVLSGLKGQALEVVLDDHAIFAIGDPHTPTANFWNKTFIIPLPAENSPSAKLEIHLTSASYPINISIDPCILPQDVAEKRVMWIDLVNNDLLLISIGGALLIGWLLIMLSLIRGRGITAEVLAGLATILGALETFDYIFRVSTGSLVFYFAIKKLLMISGYLAAYFFLAALEKYFRDHLKVSKYLAVPTIITVVLILVQPDLISLSNSITFLNLVMLVDLLVAVFLIFKEAGEKDWLLIPAIWLVMGFLEILAIQIFDFPWPYVMSYILLISTIVFGINMLVEFSQVVQEKEDLEKRIDIDTLTSAYNRNVLEKASHEQYDVLVLMDLDNFKSYNDRYGHQKGDRLLVQFTEIIKDNLRQNDLVVRYGGDEFLVLLSDIGIIEAERVAERIRKEFEAATEKDHLSVSYGIEKIFHSIDSDLTKADRLMYAMKQAKHDQKK